MVAHSQDSVLNESSTSILKFLLEQRVIVERDINERLSVLIEDIPKTDQSFDSFMLFLAKESRYHIDLANSLYNLTGSSVAGDECLMKTIDYLKTFYSVASIELQALQSQILSSLQSSRALNSSLETPVSIESPKNITSTSSSFNGASPASVGGPNSSAELSGILNISTTSSTATVRNIDQTTKDTAPPAPLPVPAIKPPSEVASSGHKPWFGRRRKKKPDTSTKKQSPRDKSPDKKDEFDDVTADVPQIPGVVDSDGYSIRPEIANDDLDNFYSSSDEDGTTAMGENEALESTQPIKFQIRPISEADLRAKTPLNDKASTEELRDMALNLVIPERPIKRGLIRGGHLNAADPKLRNTVDVSDMLGLKPSISQKSLNSDCSGISDHSGSLPPPAKPPPRTYESQSATSSTTSIMSPQNLTVPGMQNANTPSDSRFVSSSGTGINSDFNASFKSQTSSSSVTPTPPALPARKPPQTSATLVRPLPSVPVPPPRPTPSVPPKIAQPTTSSASNVSSSSTIPFQTPPTLPPKLPPRRQSITSLSGSGVLERKPSVPSRPARAESLDVKMDPFAAKSSTIALASGGLLSRQDSCSSTTSATCNLGPGDQLSSGFELPLSFSFHEKISAIIKSEDIALSTVQILGSLNLMFPAENVEKIVNSKLGKICFEVPELMAFQECIQINCLQPLVEVREKEAVDDPVVYEIEPSSLVEYIETKPQMNSYHIKLIQYQIKVDKQTDCVEESMHLAPLQIMSYCKTAEDDKVINVKIEYMYNEGAFSGSLDDGNQQPPLQETSILARVVQPNSKSAERLLNGGSSNTREVESVNSEPEALWDNESNQVIWQLGTVSPNSGPNQAKGAGVLKAKFALKSPLVIDPAPVSGIESDVTVSEKLATVRSDLSPDEMNASLNIGQDDKLKSVKGVKREKIVAVGARFRCEGSVTGINVKLADNESNNYKLAPVIHNTSTGQYISLTV
ncbi:uncharacterized protein LOC142345926 [Convolutriloba macropyga]|uniref:uncharacterized protein LOC142345926 n=1 Tax=Convolutriloba macropyga TaxID=536237 RepID=UPI003F51BD4F